MMRKLELGWNWRSFSSQQLVLGSHTTSPQKNHKKKHFPQLQSASCSQEVWMFRIYNLVSCTMELVVPNRSDTNTRYFFVMDDLWVLPSLQYTTLSHQQLKISIKTDKTTTTTTTNTHPIWWFIWQRYCCWAAAGAVVLVATTTSQFLEVDHAVPSPFSPYVSSSSSASSAASALSSPLLWEYQSRPFLSMMLPPELKTLWLFTIIVNLPLWRNWYGKRMAQSYPTKTSTTWMSQPGKWFGKC